HPARGGWSWTSRSRSARPTAGRCRQRSCATHPSSPSCASGSAAPSPPTPAERPRGYRTYAESWLATALTDTSPPSTTIRCARSPVSGGAGGRRDVVGPDQHGRGPAEPGQRGTGQGVGEVLSARDIQDRDAGGELPRDRGRRGVPVRPLQPGHLVRGVRGRVGPELHLHPGADRGGAAEDDDPLRRQLAERLGGG